MKFKLTYEITDEDKFGLWTTRTRMEQDGQPLTDVTCHLGVIVLPSQFKTVPHMLRRWWRKKDRIARDNERLVV